MANYYGVARSNYVKFNAKVYDLLDLFPDLELTPKREDGLQALLSSSDDGTPCASDHEEAIQNLGLDYDPDFYEVVHLCLEPEPNNVLIWMQCGHEKLRYISGGAIAINHTGIIRQVSLNDIYDGHPEWSEATY